jgi:hypothetical protein
MKKAILAGALALACSAGTAQAAVTIDFTGGSGVLPGDSSVVENFDALTAGALLSGGVLAYVSDGSIGLRPNVGSTGNFGAVAGGGSYTINFFESKLFSFVLGSLDAYNTLTLTYKNGSSDTFTGGAIVGNPLVATGAPGNGTSAATNGVVTYRVNPGDSLITGVTFSSTFDAFEFDNLSTDVPEPAAWAMMIFGFALVGGSLRRRPSVKVNFA